MKNKPCLIQIGKKGFIQQLILLKVLLIVTRCLFKKNRNRIYGYVVLNSIQSKEYGNISWIRKINQAITGD